MMFLLRELLLFALLLVLASERIIISLVRKITVPPRVVVRAFPRSCERAHHHLARSQFMIIRELLLFALLVLASERIIISLVCNLL